MRRGWSVKFPGCWKNLPISPFRGLAVVIATAKVIFIILMVKGTMKWFWKLMPPLSGTFLPLPVPLNGFSKPALELKFVASYFEIGIIWMLKGVTLIVLSKLGNNVVSYATSQNMPFWAHKRSSSVILSYAKLTLLQFKV